MSRRATCRCPAYPWPHRPRGGLCRFPDLPAGVWSRPKQGFSAPDASWFRGESIDYVNRLLRDPQARIFDFIEPSYVRGVLDEHTAGQVNHRLVIWSCLCFEWWLRRFIA